METLREAIERLSKEGYGDQFRAEGGKLRATGADRLFDPEELKIERIVRFEGTSDPGDETAVFVLQGAGGTRGTYTVAFGPGMELADAEIVPRLNGGRSDQTDRREV